MAAEGIESFLRITGPWGLVGILVFLIWDMFRKNDKSLREILMTQTSVLDHLADSMNKLETRLEDVDKGQRDLVAQLKVLVRLGNGG